MESAVIHSPVFNADHSVGIHVDPVIRSPFLRGLLCPRPKSQCFLFDGAATSRGRSNNDGADVFADVRLRVCSCRRFQQ